MNRTKNILMAVFFGFIIISLVIVELYENDILDCGILVGDKNVEFLLVATMELLTVALIPLALRMFRFRRVADILTSDEDRAASRLLVWGSLRLCCLGIPMAVNALLYYLYMNTTFGYMGIILLICMPFVYPSMNRCISETTKKEE